MPNARIPNVRIGGIVTSLPPTVRSIDDDPEALGGNLAQIERIKKTIGLDKRRVALPGTTALDLCEHAARELLQRTATSADSIDGVIFVTQTPDHFQPSNATLLHGRLGLRDEVAAFDVNLGCSGYVYGLWLAHQMLATGGCERVLLLAGDTMSQCVNPRDRSVAPLFGDAGTATLLVAAPGAPAASFSLRTSGKGSEHIIIPAGAFRARASETSRTAVVDAEGNWRSPEDLAMNGGEVFNFSIRVEPPAVKQILDYAGVSAEQVDYFVFHQANRYIIGNIARRLGLPPEKVPADTVARYGNQSSASIPCTICDALSERLRSGAASLVLSGFGVGLSWATVHLAIGPVSVCDLVEYQQKQ